MVYNNLSLVLVENFIFRFGNLVVNVFEMFVF